MLEVDEKGEGDGSKVLVWMKSIESAANLLTADGRDSENSPPLLSRAWILRSILPEKSAQKAARSYFPMLSSLSDTKWKVRQSLKD